MTEDEVHEILENLRFAADTLELVRAEFKGLPTGRGTRGHIAKQTRRYNEICAKIGSAESALRVALEPVDEFEV